MRPSSFFGVKEARIFVIYIGLNNCHGLSNMCCYKCKVKQETPLQDALAATSKLWQHYIIKKINGKEFYAV